MKFSSNEISSRASNRISRSPVTYSRWQKNTIFWSLSGHGNRSRTVYLSLARPARFHARVRTYVLDAVVKRLVAGQRGTKRPPRAWNRR